MKIALIHLGTPSECFMSTPVLKGLKSAYDNPEITCVVGSENAKSIFKYNNAIKDTLSIVEAVDKVKDNKYDLLLNLHPDFSFDRCFPIEADDKRGFGFSPDSDALHDMLYGNKKTHKNIFQIYFNLAGLKWRGEGYDFHYHPKSRSGKNRTGLAIANTNLRHYVIEKLELEASRVWYVPFKQNIFRKMDEINKCQQIITDDLFTMNVSVYLRKNIYFLKTIPYNFKLEFFGKGIIFPVPINII